MLSEVQILLTHNKVSLYIPGPTKLAYFTNGGGDNG